MIEEVKKIKLEDLGKEKVNYENTISQHLDKLYQQLYRLQDEQTKGLTVRSNFSFIEKYITKRREYRKFKEQSKKLSELPTLISNTKSALTEEKSKLEKSGVYSNLKEVCKKIDLIKNAQTLYDIGITPIDAIKLLESNGIQPLLSEADKVTTIHPRDYSSKSSLIGVHKTQYAPKANMIKSVKDANVEYPSTVTLNGVRYEYHYKASRDTVHMSLNDEVSSHMFGSWDACKYAILLPLEDIPNKKIARAEPMDTFTRGSIALSKNSWILCPKDEVEQLKSYNPEVHVLGYEGDNVQGFSQPFLSQLGYRCEDVGMWGWNDDESSKQFCDLMKKEGIMSGPHSFTTFHEDEQILRQINEVVALSKLIKDNHLITKPEDIKNIQEQLDKQGLNIGITLSNLCCATTTMDVEPQSIRGNNKQAEVFIQEMQNNGFEISPSYKNILINLCKLSISNCTKNNKDKVFNIPPNTPEEEQKTIKELENTLTMDFDSERGDIPDKRGAFEKFISTVVYDSILHSQERITQKNEALDGPSL